MQSIHKAYKRHICYNGSLKQVKRQGAVMTAKKVTLITLGAIVGLILLAVIAIFTIRFVNQSINGVSVKGDVATSAYFEVTMPEGAQVTTKDDMNNNIYATIPTEYGEIRVSVVRVTYKTTLISDRGDVTTEEVAVDGTDATQKTIDYSNIIKGTSSKLLIRYKVGIDKIDQPSAEEYTKFEATAMSKRNLTSAEKNDVKQQTQAMLQNLVIK